MGTQEWKFMQLVWVNDQDGHRHARYGKNI